MLGFVFDLETLRKFSQKSQNMLQKPFENRLRVNGSKIDFHELKIIGLNKKIQDNDI